MYYRHTDRVETEQYLTGNNTNAIHSIPVCVCIHFAAVIFFSSVAMYEGRVKGQVLSLRKEKFEVTPVDKHRERIVYRIVGHDSFLINL